MKKIVILEHESSVHYITGLLSRRGISYNRSVNKLDMKDISVSFKKINLNRVNDLFRSKYNIKNRQVVTYSDDYERFPEYFKKIESKGIEVKVVSCYSAILSLLNIHVELKDRFYIKDYAVKKIRSYIIPTNTIYYDDELTANNILLEQVIREQEMLQKKLQTLKAKREELESEINK